MSALRPVILLRFLVLAALSTMTACTTIGQRGKQMTTAPDSITGQILTSLDRTNAGLQTFKGIGSLKLWKNDTAQVQERMAWIGAVPSRLSVVVFASGRPALKMATDGKRLYAVDFYNPKRTFYETPAANLGLKRLISLPLKPGDMVTLLSGRIPISAHQKVQLQPDASGKGFVVSLINWSRTVQKIFLNSTRDEVRKIEMFGNRGVLLYRAEFDSRRMVQGYRVPFMLNISDDAGNRMRLDIERYMADVAVDPSMFVLKPPK